MEYLYNAYKLLVCINVICSIFFLHKNNYERANFYICTSILLILCCAK